MNPANRQFEFILSDLIHQFSGHEPRSLMTNLAVFEEGRIYLKGTTIPAIINQYSWHKSGLLIPNHALSEKAPIDYVYRYIPLEEISDVPINLEAIIDIISQLDQDDFLSACSKFTDMAHPSGGTTELEDLIKTEMPFLHSKVKRLLEKNHKYFGPQAPLVLMKLAILNESTRKDLPKVNLPTFILLCLAIQNFFSPERSDASNLNLAMELPANYSIHRKLDPAYEFRQYQRRWEGEEECSKFLRKSFQENCGFPSSKIAEFVAGLAMQERDLRMNFRFEESGDDDFNMRKALELISINIEQFKDRISNPTTPNFIWDFSIFHEFPVIQRSDGQYVVVEKSLLVNRGLGWPLIYDSNVKDASLLHDIAMFAERQSKEIVVETLGDAWSSRIVDGSDLISLFGGPGIQSADLAIEFENAWLVLEISTFRTPFKALAAESQTLYKELIVQVADEAVQAVSTCEQLAKHSLDPSIEFREISSASKMYPMVVATEKFTTNPLTLSDIRLEVDNRRGGRNPRIAPVEVVNLEELEILLLLSKIYGLSIVSLLEEKAQSAFWSDSVNNFLITFYREALVGLTRN